MICKTKLAVVKNIMLILMICMNDLMVMIIDMGILMTYMINLMTNGIKLKRGFESMLRIMRVLEIQNNALIEGP